MSWSLQLGCFTYLLSANHQITELGDARLQLQPVPPHQFQLYLLSCADCWRKCCEGYRRDLVSTLYVWLRKRRRQNKGEARADRSSDTKHTKQTDGKKEGKRETGVKNGSEKGEAQRSLV